MGGSISTTGGGGSVSLVGPTLISTAPTPILFSGHQNGWNSVSGDGGSYVKTAVGTFNTALALIKRNVGPLGRIQARVPQLLGRIIHAFLAVWADDSYEALGHDAVERGNEIVRLDAHVYETSDYVSRIVGMDRCED